MQPSRLHIATALIAASILLCSLASAHGYINSPASRAYQCSTGANTDCGNAKDEPQSVEGPKGFPQRGPEDGSIASGENFLFHKLDAQTSTRWTKVAVRSGVQTFQWTLTAPHRSDKWEYFITKPGWNPDAPLTRADFELLCIFHENGIMPGHTISHNCEVPQRTGYHVILGVWTIVDTPNAAYQVVDVNYLK